MVIREASPDDIENLQAIRNAVIENALSDPGRIPREEYEDYLTTKGKGWLCEINNEVVGFAIVSVEEKNVWALFIKKEFEGRHIGSRLHDIMINWYFNQTKESIWLSTAPGTRAEKLYRHKGWTERGMMNNNKEIRFEMSFENHVQKSKSEIRNSKSGN